MSSQLSREQIVDLLKYLGASKIVNREGKEDVMFTCTVHKESNPSAGYNLEKGVFHCFSCHSTGGLEYLIMQSCPEDFPNLHSVDKFILKRYGVDLARKDLEKVKELRRIGFNSDEEVPIVKKIFPKSYLAPFKSGKETYKYFYTRGFTSETLKNFKIGRDLVSKTVTVPIYDDESNLVGVIGRYIDPNRPSNQRYKVYENTFTGDYVFPQDKCKSIDDVIIIVEGLLDSLYMHQLGYTNTVALLTNFLSESQANWIRKRASRVIDLTDNDEMGDIATQSILTKMKYKRGVRVINAKHLYPKGKKDPCDCTEEDIKSIINKCLEKPKLVRR